MTLFKFYSIPVEGENVVIVGASNIVGRPLALEFLYEGATITVCHRFTKNLQIHVEMADILISATGKRDIIKSSWIKEGSTIVDVGIIRISDEKTGKVKIRGDIDFETAKERCKAITPTPGGTGPVTVISLMQNVYQSYAKTMNI